MMPEELLARVDEAAADELMSRSEFIRQALLRTVLAHKTKDNFKNEDKIPKWLNISDS